MTFQAASPLFPAGAQLTAHVRARHIDTTILASLSTENGGLVRVSDTEIDIVIPASATASMTFGTVVLDVLRTDTEPDVHLGFSMTIPVVLPVTRLA